MPAAKWRRPFPFGGNLRRRNGGPNCLLSSERERGPSIYLWLLRGRTKRDARMVMLHTVFLWEHFRATASAPLCMLLTSETAAGGMHCSDASPFLSHVAFSFRIPTEYTGYLSEMISNHPHMTSAVGGERGLSKKQTRVQSPK